MEITHGDEYLILNRDLRASHLPLFRVRDLDPHGYTGAASEAGPSDQQWGELWSFALTFNAYRADHEQPGVLRDGQAIIDRYEVDGTLPPQARTGALRSALFQLQRREGHAISDVDCPPRTQALLDALLEAIRRRVSAPPSAAT